MASQAVLGAEGRDVLLGYLLSTDEGLSSRVASAYEQTLDRAPDVGGAAYWMQHYQERGSLNEVLAGIIVSPEALTVWPKAI